MELAFPLPKTKQQKKKSVAFLNDVSAIFILLAVVVLIVESIKDVAFEFAEYFFLAEVFFVALFTVEYLIRMVSAKDGFKYIFSPMGFVDLFSFLPSYLLFFAPVLFDVNSLKLLLILRILRSFRLFRLVRVFKLLTKKEPNSLFNSIPWVDVQTYFFLVASLIVLSGTFVYIAEANIPNTAFVNIPAGLWWAVVTATTVGYGDMVPVTFIGKTIATFTMISGFALFAMLVGVFAKTVEKTLVSQKKKKSKK